MLRPKLTLEILEVLYLSYTKLIEIDSKYMRISHKDLRFGQFIINNYDCSDILDPNEDGFIYNYEYADKVFEILKKKFYVL